MKNARQLFWFHDSSVLITEFYFYISTATLLVKHTNQPTNQPTFSFPHKNWNKRIVVSNAHTSQNQLYSGMESTNNTRWGRGKLGKGEWEVIELRGSSPLCIVYITPQHRVHFMRGVKTPLLLFYSSLFSQKPVVCLILICGLNANQDSVAYLILNVQTVHPTIGATRGGGEKFFAPPQYISPPFLGSTNHDFRN